MTRGADLFHQFPEIGIPVLVSLALEVQMIMTQFMLDDADQFIIAKFIKVFPVQFDIMRAQQVPSACRSEPVIEDCLMVKRPAEIL